MSDEFAGETFDAARDAARLRTLQGRVEAEASKTSSYISLPHLAMLCGGTEASVSARLRDAKKRCGTCGALNRARKIANNCLDCGSALRTWSLEKKRSKPGKTGLWLYRLVPTTSAPVTDYSLPYGNVQYPHCDALVLHAPGSCQFCDRHPDWQNDRVMNKINFTGHYDDGKTKCPSEERRPLERINKWYGNTPKTHDQLDEAAKWASKLFKWGTE